MSDALPDNNPKTAIGIRKLSMASIPPAGLVPIMRAMADGRRKYGLMNWREKQVSASVYYDAAMRHLMAWWDGEDVARDSGIQHLGHVAACCLILLDAEATGNLIDDRPIKGAFADLVEALMAEPTARADHAARKSRPLHLETCMATRGIRNNNPGNIDRGQDWLGLATPAEMTPEQKAEKRFAVFRSPEYGIRALAKLLQAYHDKHGLRTVRGIINRWAPPVENDTGAYVMAVAKAIGVDPGARVDVHYMAIAKPMVEAIIAHENAGYRYPESVIDQGLALSGVKA